MNIFENINLDRFLYSLQYMWKGMVCIFVVIGVIILSIVVMNTITKTMAEKKKNDN